MQQPCAQGEKYYMQLVSFTREQFALEENRISDIEGMAFLEYCLTRPVVRDSNGRVREAPICNGLPAMVDRICQHYRWLGVEPPLTKMTRGFAEYLRDLHGPPPRKAKALYPDDVREFTAALGDKPYDVRNRALLLLAFNKMSRLGDIFRVWYPDGVRAGYDHGVVLVVPRCKTRSAPQFLAVRHSSDPSDCPVCALRHWVDYLGPNYRGPLFPSLRQGQISSNPASTSNFSVSIKHLAQRTGRPPELYSSYSARRGGASTAATAGWELATIQNELWHERLAQTLDYIEPSVLMSRRRDIFAP